MMTAASTRSDPAAELEAIQVEISIALRQLGDAAPLMAQLVDSHQRGMSFLTYDGRQTLDRLHTEERRLRVVNAQLGRPLPSAPTPVPGNLTAISLQADIWSTLHHQIRRITRALARGVTDPETSRVTYDEGGLCIISRRPIPAEATVQDLLSKLRHLAFNAPSKKLLTAVRDELEQLADITAAFVEGNRPGLFEEACPFCGHHTLVIYPGEDLIRCDRDPETGRFNRCVCPDWTCPCHTDPIDHRHEWRRPVTFGHRSYEDGLLLLIKNERTRHEEHDDMRSQTIGINRTDRGAAERLLLGYFHALHDVGAVGEHTPTTDLGVDAMCVALASLVPDDGEAQHHSIALTFESGEGTVVEFVCTAPVGSDCRMAPACMMNGICFGSEDGHHTDCPPGSPARDKIDAGYCLVKTWIDVDPAIMGTGRLELPVTTEWTGDDYLYTPFGAEAIS